MAFSNYKTTMQCTLCPNSGHDFVSRCGHMFHKTCIDKHAEMVCEEYLTVSSITCPVCHTNLLTVSETKDVKDVCANDFHTCCNSIWLPNDVANDYEWAVKQRMEELLGLVRDLLYPERVAKRKFYERRETAKRKLVKQLDDEDPERIVRRRARDRMNSYNMLRIMSGYGGLCYNDGPSTRIPGDFYDEFGGGHFTYTANEEWVKCED